MFGNLSGNKILLIILILVLIGLAIYWWNRPQYSLYKYGLPTMNPALTSQLSTGWNKVKSAFNPADIKNKLAATMQDRNQPYYDPGMMPRNPNMVQKEPKRSMKCLDDVPFKLYNFYSPQCGWSTKFMPVWNEVASRLDSIDSIGVMALDATLPENENISFYYNVTGYPTIILVTPSRNLEYTGDRNAEDLYQFVIKAMRDHQ